MISNRMNLALRHFYKRGPWNIRLHSKIAQTNNERNPEPFFFNRDVQKYLYILTRVDAEKVFEARKDGTPLRVPIFKFMTDEELQKERQKIRKVIRNRLQMPPVVKKKSDEFEVLSDDPALQGLSESNFVFTDISLGSNVKRLIVVRDTNGLLRHANCSERRRMNQVYFPIRGREIHVPEMFKDPYLSDLLNREEYIFILDRACLQFEPDDPEYHRITERVYFQVNNLNKFDVLRSTRHFGPFAFYLAWRKNIDKLLLDLIQSKNIEEATSLIYLYHKLHPDAKSTETSTQDDLELLKSYAELDSLDRFPLITAIESYELLKKEMDMVNEGIEKAHGLVTDDDESKNEKEEPKT